MQNNVFSERNLERCCSQCFCTNNGSSDCMYCERGGLWWQTNWELLHNTAVLESSLEHLILSAWLFWFYKHQSVTLSALISIISRSSKLNANITFRDLQENFKGTEHFVLFSPKIPELAGLVFCVSCSFWLSFMLAWLGNRDAQYWIFFFFCRNVNILQLIWLIINIGFFFPAHLIADIIKSLM